MIENRWVNITLEQGLTILIGKGRKISDQYLHTRCHTLCCFVVVESNNFVIVFMIVIIKWLSFDNLLSIYRKHLVWFSFLSFIKPKRWIKRHITETIPSAFLEHTSVICSGIWWIFWYTLLPLLVRKLRIIWNFNILSLIHIYPYIPTLYLMVLILPQYYLYLTISDLVELNM